MNILTLSIDIAYAKLGMGGGSHRYSVVAGSTIDDFVILANLGNEDINVQISQDKKFALENGNYSADTFWLEKLHPIMITPDGEKEYRFKIQVPSNVPNGTYFGMIVASEVDPESKSSSENIRVISRLGSNVYITVTGGTENILEKNVAENLATHQEKATLTAVEKVEYIKEAEKDPIKKVILNPQAESNTNNLIKNEVPDDKTLDQDNSISESFPGRTNGILFIFFIFSVTIFILYAISRIKAP